MSDCYHVKEHCCLDMLGAENQNAFGHESFFLEFGYKNILDIKKVDAELINSQLTSTFFEWCSISNLNYKIYTQVSERTK